MQKKFYYFSGFNDFIKQFPTENVLLGIGNYDGLHHGHREIFSSAKKNAITNGYIFGALTFTPHPEAFFLGKEHLKLIYPEEEKNKLFEDFGLNFSINLPFTTEFSNILAENFLAFLKKQIPNLKGIYVGDNFRFGHKRLGNLDLLKAQGKKLNINIVINPPVLFDNERISSSRIRQLLLNGEIDLANNLLDKDYFCSGNIIKGRQLGRQLGFPTLNLKWEPELRPKYGVYAVRIQYLNEILYGVANYGLRPSVEKSNDISPLLEIHILNSDLKIIPTTSDFIIVSWIHFIRPEMKFESLNELKEQIKKDKKSALHYFVI